MSQHHHAPQPLFISFQRLLWDLFLLMGGSILCAVAINGIVIPQQFATGGIAGISLIIHKKIPLLNAGYIYSLLNIPLFALAWMIVGRRFFFYSILGTISLTMAIAVVHFPIHLEDKILSAILAGLIQGVGTGISLRSSGSQGGLDILSIMLYKRFSISLGSTVLGTNALVLLLVSFVYSFDAVLYTLIVIYVASKVVNVVVTGFSQRKVVFIISPHWEMISQEILKDQQRGVTIIQGEGGYTHQPEHIIYTVIPLSEIAQVKLLIQDIDSDAFVVISDSLEVMNNRIGNQPHW